jgi:hypothetical protein
VIILLAPSLLRELAGWVLAAVVVWRWQRLGRISTVSAGSVFLVLAAGGLGAFRERVVSDPGAYSDADALLARARADGDAAKRRVPALASMLVRVSPAPAWLSEFLYNSAPAAGLASLDGYYFPQRRFVALMRAARGQRYDPNALQPTFKPDMAADRTLFQLYNVAWRLDEAGGLTPLGATAGPAWFSAGLVRSSSLPVLAQELVGLGDELALRARQVAWLVASDPMVARAALPEAVDEGCAQARVESAEAPRQGTPITARVFAPADCPLTFATNYAETLRATASMADGRSRPATVYPAYGALAGVWVPRGAVAVSVEAVVPRPPWPELWRGLGLGLLLWLLIRAPRSFP